MQNHLSNNIILGLNLWVQPQQLILWVVSKKFIAHVHSLCPQHNSNSMDGANVNWKMVEIANEHSKEQDPYALPLLQMESCVIPVLHGAYKTAQSVTSRKLDKFLKSCFSIFKQTSC